MRVLPISTLVTLAFAAACGASAPAVTASSPANPAGSSLASASPAPSPSSNVEAPDAGIDASSGAAEPSAPPAAEAAAASSTSACNEQAPQDFLIRGNFRKVPTGNERAIQYRTEQYGYFKGFGRAPHDAQAPSAQVVSTTFMGLPVRMHRKVVPALACVEKEIERACADHPYKPHALAGIRFRNTYRGGEVTNHAYGIAIDVDPDINTCCGCVKPWSDAPACKRAGKSEYDHMAMPECWVHAFELYGFYWLGHDVLRDTMHYEFLGDPDKIVKEGSLKPTPSSSPAPP
jgi:hypothetical protein